MKKELQDKLIEQFPSMFVNMGCDYTKSAMVFGIQCGDGWYGLLERLCQEITSCDCAGTFKFTQIKEKFGTLRVYFEGSGNDNEIYPVVQQAEGASAYICEDCGTSLNGITTEASSGWVSTLCKPCRSRVT